MEVLEPIPVLKGDTLRRYYYTMLSVLFVGPFVKFQCSYYIFEWWSPKGSPKFLIKMRQADDFSSRKFGES